MRQWLVNPKILCTQHLLGEHVEHHSFVGTINKGKSVEGYIRNKLLNPQDLLSRHDELAEEMIRRGYKHSSPLPNINRFMAIMYKVDVEQNYKTLKERCQKCKVKIEEYERINNDSI